MVLAAPLQAVGQGTPADQPSALDRTFKAAVSAYNEGQPAKASALLESLLPQVPKSFEVQELLGLCYGAQSQDAKAILHLQAAANLKPDSAAAKTNFATALLHAGRDTEAETQLRQALQLDPHDYNANHNLGELRIRQNRVSEAVPLLEAAQHARPTAYQNGYDLALAALLTGKLPEARQSAEALRTAHDTGEVHNLLGRIDEAEGKYLDAANEFATAAHMDPSEENLFVWASELLLHRTYEPAIAVFKDGTQRFPQSARQWIGLGMAQYSRGEYEDAVHALLTAADLDPRDPRCYLFLSKAYLSAPAQVDDVIRRFRRYAELEPDNAQAQLDYALSLWKGRRSDSQDIDYKAVEALLKRSIALNNNLADAHLQLGILYTDQHNFDAALPEYQRALQLEPNLAEAHFRLGRYYLHAGDKAKAQTELDTFKTLQTQHQAEVDKDCAEVQQFVVQSTAAPAQQP